MPHQVEHQIVIPLEMKPVPLVLPFRLEESGVVGHVPADVTHFPGR